MSADATGLLDNKETSAQIAFPASFQQHLLQGMIPAWLSSGTLYHLVDQDRGTRYEQTMLDCRTSSWFARNKQSGEVRVLGSACKLRWCPLCAKAKRTYITHQIAAWIKSTRYHRFITFTLKHADDDLSYQIDRLYDCFKKVRRSKVWRTGSKHGVWFFQIKRSKQSGQWHPHIHCVSNGPWFDYKALRKRWLEVTGDSKVVGIHPVKDPEKCANEVARYASSPADLPSHSSDDRFQIFEALHNRRICGTWGLKGIVQLKPPPAENKGDWVNIGSWQYIHDTHTTDSRSQAIIDAWRNRQPLPESYEQLTIPVPQKTMFEIYEEQRNSGYQLSFFH